MLNPSKMGGVVVGWASLRLLVSFPLSPPPLLFILSSVSFPFLFSSLGLVLKNKNKWKSTKNGRP